jgi:hypothetical protein
MDAIIIKLSSKEVIVLHKNVMWYPLLVIIETNAPSPAINALINWPIRTNSILFIYYIKLIIVFYTTYFHTQIFTPLLGILLSKHIYHIKHHCPHQDEELNQCYTNMFHVMCDHTFLVIIKFSFGNFNFRIEWYTIPHMAYIST